MANMKSLPKRFSLTLCGLLCVLIVTAVPARPEDRSGPLIHVLTPEQVLGTVWNHFLAAMSSGSDRAVHAECTEAGYQNLLSFLNDREPHADQWQRWSQSWSKWGPVHWQSITPIIAYGKLGPKQKPATVNFALTPLGWKLDHLSPAE